MTNEERRGERTRHQMNWAEAPLASFHGRKKWWVWLSTFFIAVGASLDSALIVTVVERVLAVPSVAAWIISMGLGFLAAFGMFSAGRTARGVIGNLPGQRVPLIAPSLLVLTWFLVGVAMAIMRLESAARASALDSGVALSGVDISLEGGAAAEWIPALTFLVIYMLTGVMACFDGYHSRNDAFSAMRIAKGEYARALVELADAESLFRRLLDNQEIRKHEMRDAKSGLELALQRTTAVFTEAKQYARVELAKCFGDPSATGITSIRHPSNPAHRPE